MNTMDRKLLIGLTAISVIAFVALEVKKKNNKPMRVLGLDADHSIKFVGAIAVISGGMLAYNLFGKKMIKQ